MEKSFNIQNTKLVIKVGDLLLEEVDAIVNPANQKCLGGGGVDGKIHKAAGPKLLEECQNIPEIKPHVRVLTGNAVITGSYNLPQKHIIHTVGPRYREEAREECEKLLYDAYYNALKLAAEKNIKKIAFPAISTGVYLFPLKEAQEIAIKAIQDFITKENQLEEVRLVYIREVDANIGAHAAERILTFQPE